MWFVQAMKAGLAASEVTAPNAIQMAESLLNIGLENNSRSFLISCIKVTFGSVLSMTLFNSCLSF